MSIGNDLINDSLEITPFSCFGYRLGYDPKRWIKAMLIIGAIFFGVVGIGFIASGHHYFPQNIPNIESQFIIGGKVLGIAAAFGVAAFITPLILSRFNNWRIKRFILDNYELFTNMDTEGKDLEDLIEEAGALFFAEKHNSKVIIENNRDVIEALWNGDGNDIFHSEINDPNAESMLSAYDLYPGEINHVASWDIRREESVKVNQNIKSVFWWALKLTEIQSAENRKKQAQKVLASVPQQEKVFESIKNTLKSYSENPSDELLSYLFRDWSILARIFMDEYLSETKEIGEKWDTRQCSLVQNVFYYYQEGKRIFLIAGRDHLLIFTNEKWECVEGIKPLLAAGVPLLIFLPKVNSKKPKVAQETSTQKTVFKETSVQGKSETKSATNEVIDYRFLKSYVDNFDAYSIGSQMKATVQLMKEQLDKIGEARLAAAKLERSEINPTFLA